MKRKFLTKMTSLVLALVIIFSLSGCLENPKHTPLETPKEDILSAVEQTLENDTHNYPYVYQYLILWGVSGFDSTKFKYYEQVFKYNYNFEDGLPETLTHAKDTVQYFIENYYDNTNLEDHVEVTNALLNCYVYAVGDPYAFYRTADQFAEFEEDMSGTFGGIGIQIEYNHNEQTLLVNQVFKDGPGDIGGIKVGDYIIGVDGKTLEELGGYQNAIYYVRGEVGTDVTVTVDRNGETLHITMTRALITETVVEHHLTDDGFGYIRINSFKDNTFEQFRFAVEELEALGAKGFIFDVRSNPGGYVYSVGDVLSYILPTGKTIISYQYKNQSAGYYVTSADPHPEDETIKDYDHTINLPFVVLCDEYTASAGEIFVACLRDYEAEGILEDVVIIGDTTFGKGIMQGSKDYPSDKSYVTLTVSYYNPPSGVNYHGTGITPDIFVEYSETGDAHLEEAINQMKILLESK